MPFSVSSRIGNLLNSSLRRRVVAGSLVLFGGLTLGAVNASPASAAGLNATQISNAVFAQLNRERASHHLAPLRRSGGLNSSAKAHNIAMARVNVMTHQTTHEAGLGARINRTGYRWQSAAENVGWNSDMSKAGALRLETMMFTEKAPYDGHRRNILNPHTRDVGINVVVDYRHHKIWLTEDFGTHA